MLDISKNNNNELDFSMYVSTSRKIDIYWSNIESKLKENHKCKQIIFIDPIELSFFPELVDLELGLPHLVIVPTNLGEKEKDIDTLLSILSLLEQEGVGRRTDKIYAVGGGVLLDVISFACSVFRRGVHLTKLPTTLLEYIDASIGLKTGINI